MADKLRAAKCPILDAAYSDLLGVKIVHAVFAISLKVLLESCFTFYCGLPMPVLLVHLGSFNSLNPADSVEQIKNSEMYMKIKLLCLC